MEQQHLLSCRRRLRQRFAGISHQPDPVSPTNPCFGPAAQAKWTLYTFAAWQRSGEDVQSVVKNPGTDY